MKRWQQKNGNMATVRVLARALWDIERSDIAFQL